jgi:hypothetical protein
MSDTKIELFKDMTSEQLFAKFLIYLELYNNKQGDEEANFRSFVRLGRYIDSLPDNQVQALLEENHVVRGGYGRVA